MRDSHRGERIVLASNNAGKVREINQLLTEQQIEILPQSECGVPEVEETGLSFVENAILKARNASAHSGLPAIADDSGIEVDALRGAPGIYSARFAGAGASDQANLEKLLEELAAVPDGERTARRLDLRDRLVHAVDAEVDRESERGHLIRLLHHPAHRLAARVDHRVVHALVVIELPVEHLLIERPGLLGIADGQFEVAEWISHESTPVLRVR